MTSDLSNSLSHGFKVYSTVMCSNRGGLTSSAYSDGVTILSPVVRVHISVPLLPSFLHNVDICPHLISLFIEMALLSQQTHP